MKDMKFQEKIADITVDVAKTVFAMIAIISVRKNKTENPFSPTLCRTRLQSHNSEQF